ncbi:dephospho-CoA kinase [Bifidobacterium aemilianum]|uniref:Dephospho-CoA kinase n=1 Tax=Bifidobacterium aemilianum TaxID=2493120 RepID=A0A366K9F5_9BIFI|nr:dephospho-CoA kinase [Bifidobacterium aemilianum]RBP98356.1 dephospho-CoA kinase [Bifidobacterium aemilianum]
MIERIGLTGGIAAGKSTVAAHLVGLGAKLVDYDVLARKVVEPGSEGLREIVRSFGPQCLDAQGSLDRSWLADHVFGSLAMPGARERLDAIEHPRIYALAQAMEAQYLASAAAAGAQPGPAEGRQRLVLVHDVPLLAEVVDDLPFSFDHILTVEAPEDLRVQRMVEDRGMTREQALSRISSQPADMKRLALADLTLDSTQKIEQMFECLDSMYASWQNGE